MLRQSFSEHKDEPLLANAAGDDGAAANEFDDEASPVASRSSRCQLGKSIQWHDADATAGICDLPLPPRLWRPFVQPND